MSTSTFELRVEASDPLAVVEIAGPDYAIHMKGGERIVYAAAPGLYIARAKFKDSVSERVIRIKDKDEQVEFSSPALALQDAPGAVTESALAKKVAESRMAWTADTWVTLAIKGLQSAHSQELDYPAIRINDFSVCDLFGEEIKSFQAAVLEQAMPESVAPGVYPGEVASVDLPQGWYALSMPGRDQTRVMLPLYVAPRFSPTIFIQTIAEGPDEIGIDFDKLLVSYDPDEQDSANDQLEWRAIEAARRSLELGRNTLTPSLMRVLLEGKIMNPMLGLLALQMLLLPESGSRKREPPASHAPLFQEVASNVSELLGAPNHPDLVLARARARKCKWPIEPASGDDEPLIAPPLLKANWQFLNSMKSRRPELASKRSFLYDVGRSLLQAGVWVVWKPPAGEGIKEYSWPKFSLPDEYESRLALRLPQDDAIDGFAFAAPARPSPARPRLPRKTADDQLAEIANLIRDNTFLQTALLNDISSVPPRGSVLDRTVAKTALQLANLGEERGRGIPRGYVSQLARNLSLPRSMVCDSIAKVEKALQEGRLQDAGAFTIDEQYLLP